VEESYASQAGGYCAELQAEMDELAWCSALVFQFPLWWLGMPAIVRGGIDRVFAVAQAYGGGTWFDRGWLAGKRALCSITVGRLERGVFGERDVRGAAAVAAPDPSRHARLRRAGRAGAVCRVRAEAHDRGRAECDPRTYARRVLELETAATLPSPRSADHDERMQAKPA
jgi:NAD(P)H dehydrogenase (quinone)